MSPSVSLLAPEYVDLSGLKSGWSIGRTLAYEPVYPWITGMGVTQFESR